MKYLLNSSALLFILSFSYLALAKPVDKYKDQSFEVTPDIEQCSAKIDLKGEDNCKTETGTRGDCEGVKACVCSTKGKKIKWKSTNNDIKLKINFKTDTPFKDNCTDKAKKTVVCTVKGNVTAGNYDYDIYLESAEKKCDEPIDPRVIIKMAPPEPEPESETPVEG